MRVAVSGSHGLIGSALVGALEAAGHQVVRLTRGGPTRAGEVRWDPERGQIDGGSLAGVDGAVHLAGAGSGPSSSEASAAAWARAGSGRAGLRCTTRWRPSATC